MGERKALRKLYILANAIEGRTAAFRVGGPWSLWLIHQQRTVYNKSVELLSGMARKACLGARGGIMGEFGYFFGYSLVFVFCMGIILGFVIGRWFSK